MHLITLILLALGMGGGEVPSVLRWFFLPSISSTDFTVISGNSPNYGANFNLADQKIREILLNGEQQNKKHELTILKAFYRLSPVAQGWMGRESTDALATMRRVLKEHGHALTPLQLDRLRLIVSDMAKKLFESWFTYSSATFKESFPGAMAKIVVFQEFASFSHEPPPNTLECQAKRVLSDEKYFNDLSKRIEDGYSGSGLRDFLSENCDLSKERQSDSLEQGLWILDEAAANGINLGHHGFFRDFCNFVLCAVTRNETRKLEEAIQTTGEPMELQRNPMQV